MFELIYFTGYPQPIYRWLKDGLPMTDFTNSQYYRIHNTRPDDAGSYQCIAKNEVGTIFSEKIDVVVACKYIFLMNFRIIYLTVELFINHLILIPHNRLSFLNIFQL